MNTEVFVSGLREAVVEENIAIYRQIFSETALSSATDPYWQRALHLYANLTVEEREVLFEIMKQVAMDTVSNVLGVIDGVSVLGGMSQPLELRSGADVLSGDLQSQFLVLDEQAR